MNVQDISKPRLRRVTARWHDPSHSGHTYCLKPGETPAEIGLPEEPLALLQGSGTGAFLFWSLAESHLVIPPFPVEKQAELAGWQVGPLQSLLDRQRTVLVMLLRMGGFAVGIFQGERLVSSKVGSRFVKGRHKKGGSSAGRFARRREGQERALFDKACETLHAQVEGFDGRLEHMVLGGDRMTLQAFEKRCPDMRRLGAIRTGRVLTVPDPRLAVLKDIPRLMYSSRVVSFASHP